jgi:UDP-2,4-diacetamido-2,4,6-trideoxy-beta-L-altropyranose hydrolase
MTVLFRADGGTQTGTGHLMRCLALAQAVQDSGGKAVFACAEIPDSFRERLVTEGCQIVDIREKNNTAEIVQLMSTLNASWIVIDGYGFDGPFQKSLKGHDFHVLAVDDYGHAGEYAADLVLNQNLSAKAELYARRSPETRLLLGPSYALLRREFRTAHLKEKEIQDQARHLLVTLGGADPGNLTARIARILTQLHIADLKVTFVVGGSNPHLHDIEEATRDHASFRVLHNVRDMTGLLQQCDMTITAAGTTSLEMLRMGVPMVTGVIAENQEGIARSLEKEKLALCVGWYDKASDKQILDTVSHLLCSRNIRKEMATQGQKIVDGQGAMRVVSMLQSPSP